MWHHSLLVLKLLQLVASAPAPGPVPDTTYNPTKEAPCTVAWDLQSDHGVTEHYEVAGHCMFKDSADKLCSGGYRAPGFCPGENDKPIDCCISRKCGGQGRAGTCVNSSGPMILNDDTTFYTVLDPACPSFKGRTALCYVPNTANTFIPGGMNPSPQTVAPEALLQQSQPMPNELSFNNNNNPWTSSAAAADVVNNDGGEGLGGIQQQQQDVGLTLVNQQQQQQAAALGVGANGGGPARDGFTLFDNYQLPPVVSLGANGNAGDGVITPDGTGS